MNPQESFKTWLPTCLTPSHEEAFVAGWEACCNLYDGRMPKASNDIADSIYAAYPRKVGRADALRAINSALKLRPAVTLLQAVNAYADATTRWPAAERQFIPHPSTWFNRGSYDDDPKEWQRVAAPAKWGQGMTIKSVATVN